MVTVVVGGLLALAGCADGTDPVDEAASPVTVASEPGEDAAGVDASVAPETDADASATLVVSGDGAGADGKGAVPITDDEDGSGAAALDAEPLESDPTGDAPAGPPAPAGANGGDATGGERPEPTVDTDTSPDDGEVPNGVSGDSDVRENLSYPTASVVALDGGATTTLAAELAGSDQPTLLWFWTPDCPTCVPESAAVADFASANAGSIRVVGVGGGGTRADADAFAAGSSLDPSLLVWSQGSATHEHYNVTATPFAIMVAPNGVVMAQWRGMVPELFAFAERL